MFRISRVIFANYRKIKCINNQVTFTPCDQRTRNTNFTQVAIAASLFSFFKKKDENEESELIMTIKRGILCIQREEHQKAEKMFHLGNLECNFRHFMNNNFLLFFSSSIGTDSTG